MTTAPQPGASPRSWLDRSLWPALALLAGVILLFELTELDLHVQDFCYSFARQAWIVDGNAPVPRFFFYDAPKLGIIVLGVSLIALACGPARWRGWFTRRHLYRRDLSVVIAVLATVPAFIGAGKALTNIFCPSEIRRYGGDVPYIRLCEPYPAGDKPARRGRCFPAGHASGGFALMALAQLATTRRGRRIGIAIGLVVGGTMGVYQTLKGAHYLSHSLVTMLVAWIFFLLWRRILRAERAVE
jgi:membrane-associated PAP2 superfamily phosphatase